LISGWFYCAWDSRDCDPAAAFHNQPSRFISVAAFCFRCDAYGSLKSPACDKEIRRIKNHRFLATFDRNFNSCKNVMDRNYFSQWNGSIFFRTVKHQSLVRNSERSNIYLNPFLCARGTGHSCRQPKRPWQLGGQCDLLDSVELHASRRKPMKTTRNSASSATSGSGYLAIALLRSLPEFVVAFFNTAVLSAFHFRSRVLLGTHLEVLASFAIRPSFIAPRVGTPVGTPRCSARSVPEFLNQPAQKMHTIQQALPSLVRPHR
jgi:hypothetical protein